MNSHPPAPALVRVLRTALSVLVAIGALVPAAVGLLGVFGVDVDGAQLVALVGVAVLVNTAALAAATRAGRAPIRRTIVQVLVAVAGIVPAVVAGLSQAGISIDQTQLVALTGFAVMVATTVQNLLEGRGTIPTLGAPSATARPSRPGATQ